MSRSGFRMTLEFYMLDGRKECVPGFENWSSGHTSFKFGPTRLRLVGPASSVFDELKEQYDRDTWVSYMVDEFKRDDATLRHMFDAAKAHCDEHHVDLRERLSNEKTSTDPDST